MIPRLTQIGLHVACRRTTARTPRQVFSTKGPKIRPRDRDRKPSIAGLRESHKLIISDARRGDLASDVSQGAPSHVNLINRKSSQRNCFRYGRGTLTLSLVHVPASLFTLAL